MAPSQPHEDSGFAGSLKAATASHHRRIEARFRILDPKLDLSRFAGWLERLYGYYAPFERAVDPWAGVLDIDWAARRKAPLLRRDLACLGADRARIEALPLCGELPELADVASLFGAIYVFEGSTLGGRYIAGHLASTLRLDATTGASFFQPYGPDPKPRWQAFQSRLCQVASTPDLEARIIRSACETFESFDRWLAASS